MKAILIFCTILLFSSCALNSINEYNIIRIKGSDTMLLLNMKLAEEFMKVHPGISVYVEGGGTSTGVNALIKNTVEIFAASRPIEPDEIKKIGENFSSVGMSFLIGRDALSIFINPENSIKSLSINQLRDIYKCKITNWQEVGGVDSPIKPVTRSKSSGTYLYFIKHVLKGDDICNSLQVVNTTKQITDFIKENINSIGYGGFGYGDGTFKCKIEGIEPTKENVINNKYPISRYLRYYTLHKPSGKIKLFIDWVSSKNGQKIVEAMGYIPLWI